MIARPEMETRFSHFSYYRFWFDHPAMACLAPGQRFDRLNILSGAEGGLSGLAVQDIYTTGWREFLIEFCQQSLAVEKQMITVQKENRINRPARQIRISLLSENGWH